MSYTATSEASSELDDSDISVSNLAPRVQSLTDRIDDLTNAEVKSSRVRASVSRLINP